MTSFLPIYRQAWRHAWRRPLQSFFLIVGVAIGVAMIVAIDLANGSADRAFQLGAETVTGKATHQITGGPSGLDEALYARVRIDAAYRLSAPVVESYVVAEALDGQPMRLLGVDPFAEAPFRSYLGPGDQAQGPAASYLTELMVQPNTVLLSTEVAERYGLAVGDTLTVRHGANRIDLTIVGLLAPSDDLSRRALDGLLATDIATAQEVLGKVGRIDRIDLIVPAGADGEAILQRIAAVLPPSARIDPTAARAGAVGEMTAAFQLNLTALSLLALVVGMFLIYNTVTFSVVQRRPVLGSLRALGMTRREIFGMILIEAMLLGALGTLLGLGLGVLLGRGAVQLVTQTVNDLFFVVSVREVETPAFTLIKGAVIGLAAAAIGAAFPAWEATSTPPAGALKRSNVEERTRRALPWLSLAGVGFLALGAALMLPEWNLIITFAGLFAVVIGVALLTPMLTLWGMALVERLVRGRGVIMRMAPRTVTRSLSRIAVAVAALMVAVSVIIGVGVMIGSFRQTVVLWLDDVLQADIFISAPSLSSNTVETALDPALLERMAAFPGIEGAATTRGVDVVASVGADNQVVPIRLVALSQDLSGADRRYRSAVGDWQQTWQAVRDGAIIINEPMANRLDLRVGDTLRIQTDRGEQAFPIAGVTVDFDVRSVVFINDAVYRQWYDDRLISAIALFVAPGVDVDAKVQEIRAALVGEQELLVRSNRGTRDNALEVFDRTFTITVALQLLATVVAFIGILSTLMSLQFERSREIGVLRATGMTRRQLWRLSLLETGLIGAVAGLLAIPTGYLLAVILIYIINLRSFGWTLEMLLDPVEFVQAFFVALIAALLAGVYPAWKIGNTPPAIAVRSE
ncbi:MAG: permease [Chloroflexota bacterium]|nr:FtsX-like permease family protein [Caldilinea sp.]GIK73960.1 MAG: permease [Chloroflexota bacterium]